MLLCGMFYNLKKIHLKNATLLKSLIQNKTFYSVYQVINSVYVNLYVWNDSAELYYCFQEKKKIDGIARRILRRVEAIDADASYQRRRWIVKLLKVSLTYDDYSPEPIDPIWSSGVFLYTMARCQLRHAPTIHTRSSWSAYERPRITSPSNVV